jgi:hypothetical protein
MLRLSSRACQIKETQSKLNTYNNKIQVIGLYSILNTRESKVIVQSCVVIYILRVNK